MDRQPPSPDGQSTRGGQPSWDVQSTSDRQPAWERQLDTLVRPSFLMAPPPEVQQSILAAVLQAAAEMPRPAVVDVAPVPVAARPISPAAYLLLAAVLVAYVAALSWVQGLLGGAGWLPTLIAQLLVATEVVFGPLPAGDPMALTWLLLQSAPGLVLLPLAWLLWQRDRAASARVA
jgi:hypothetical protein